MSFIRALPLLLLVTPTAWSFDCYMTLVKDNCWTPYNVSVDVVDADSKKVLTTALIKAGDSWIQQEFDCKPGQKLIQVARFNPSFWKEEEGKSYSGHRYFLLPHTMKPEDSAWNIPVCYPSDFIAVPLPPHAQGHCRCDFSAIPKLK
jgi:hypothetical protein